MDQLSTSYIGYLRVSTDRQGKSGLGLEAQKAAIDGFIRLHGGKIIDTLTEVETGKNDERPELAKAMRLCRVFNATLLVGKLDRLSRNIHFLTGLMQSRVRFKCCDNPFADDLTIHILAAMAEHERKMISARTKAALAAAKARGVKLGGWCHSSNSPISPNHHFLNDADRKRSAKAVTTKSNKAAADLKDLLEALHERGFKTAKAKAEEMNRLGIPTLKKKGGKWHGTTVIRIQDRINPRC